MNQFEYLTVMVSIVLGIGVSRLIADAARLIQARRHVRFYWVSIVWGVNLFLLHLQVWWVLGNGSGVALAAFTRAPWFHALVAPIFLGSTLLFIGFFSLQVH